MRTPQPAIWVERVLLCVLVFTCVTMALVILAKILVSQLYGIKHTHKVSRNPALLPIRASPYYVLSCAAGGEAN